MIGREIHKRVAATLTTEDFDSPVMSLEQMNSCIDNKRFRVVRDSLGYSLVDTEYMNRIIVQHPRLSGVALAVFKYACQAEEHGF